MPVMVVARRPADCPAEAGSLQGDGRTRSAASVVLLRESGTARYRWFRGRITPRETTMREPLISMDDIPPEGTVTADLLGREVLVMMQNGKPRAFLNICMHHGGSLKLDGDTFTCDWHGSTFDARTGKALSGPVRPDARLIMLPTRVEEDVLTYVYEEHSET
jgi:3-phenylpropionate/trans-cinnamate dioxygenase ferredoxin component